MRVACGADADAPVGFWGSECCRGFTDLEPGRYSQSRKDLYVIAREQPTYLHAAHDWTVGDVLPSAPRANQPASLGPTGGKRH